MLASAGGFKYKDNKSCVVGVFSGRRQEILLRGRTLINWQGQRQLSLTYPHGHLSICLGAYSNFESRPCTRSFAEKFEYTPYLAFPLYPLKKKQVNSYPYVSLNVLFVFLVYVSGFLGLLVQKGCCQLVLLGLKCPSTCRFACLARANQLTYQAAGSWRYLSCAPINGQVRHKAFFFEWI